MDSKHITLGLAAILGVGGLVAAGLYFYIPVEEEQQTPAPEVHEEPTQATFNSTELGLMFNYPSTYTLKTDERGLTDRMWTTIVLIDSELLRQAIENDAPEDAPAITVQIFSNPEDYTVEEWIKNLPYSYYKLSPDEVLSPTTVGGDQALSYRHSGLYENNATVAAHGGKMYMFSVGWLTPQDEQIHDFEHLLETVSFY